MPPKTKVTKEDIIQGAVNLVREKGVDSLNARAIAARLGISTQPIFSNYPSMDDLKTDVVKFAKHLNKMYYLKEIDRKFYPEYKAVGMAYIGFAKEEKALFRMLFMCDRSGEMVKNDFDQSDPSISMIMDNTGFDRDKAVRFHLAMWVFVHGVASMTATGYLDLDMEMVSQMLTDVYEGLKERFLRKGE